MKITHNELNNAISEMEQILAKGQPFAKRNKEKRIREVLRKMRIEQSTDPTLKNIWFYFKMWMGVKACQVEDYFNYERSENG